MGWIWAIVEAVDGVSLLLSVGDGGEGRDWVVGLSVVFS